MKQKELNKIITSHEKLGCHGKCADLSNTDLNSVNSEGIYLINTNLNDTNLRNAKLRITNLGWVKWHETRGKKVAISKYIRDDSND